VTVLDTSAVVDFLVGSGAAEEVRAILGKGPAAAPDVLVFEVTAVLRRDAGRGAVPAGRAKGAISDLGDLSLDLFGSLPLRERAWELRENLTAADGLFVALAERLGEPLATRDLALAAAARDLTGIETIELAA